jgi:hypothetical protein
MERSHTTEQFALLVAAPPAGDRLPAALGVDIVGTSYEPPQIQHAALP